MDPLCLLLGRQSLDSILKTRHREVELRNPCARGTTGVEEQEARNVMVAPPSHRGRGGGSRGTPGASLGCFSTAVDKIDIALLSLIGAVRPTTVFGSITAHIQHTQMS